MNCPITQHSRAYCYFFPYTAKEFPQHPVLKYPQILLYFPYSYAAIQNTVNVQFTLFFMLSMLRGNLKILY
jgi:hypothetical protein